MVGSGERLVTGTDRQWNRYAGLVLRAGLGVVFIAHALAKLLVFTLPGTAAFFEAHGFPGWSAYPVFAIELAGGLLLAAGLWTRVVSATLLPVMAGAWLVHWPNGWSFTAPGGGWEYVAFLHVALVAQVLLGDGAFALSSLVAGTQQDAVSKPGTGRATAA
jgi:putative oxidoreductase